MTRRNFLRSLLSAGIGIAALNYLLPKQWAYHFALLFKPSLDPSSPKGTLSEGDMENVIAFAEALVGKQPFSEVEKNYLARHIADRTKNTPGFFSVYKTTCELLARLPEVRSFSSLSLPERLAILNSKALASFDVQAREYLTPFHLAELTVRVLVVPDLIFGYYSSPAGWAVVRYESSPGRCGDLSRYTRANLQPS